MTQDDEPVTTSDLGTPDGHCTRWGSPYGADAAVLLVALLAIWGLFVVVMHP